MARRKKPFVPALVLDTMVWIKGWDKNPNEPFQSESRRIVSAVLDAQIRVVLPTLVIVECQSISEQMRSLLDSHARTVEPHPLSAAMGLDVAEFMAKGKGAGLTRKHRFDACHLILAESLQMPLVSCDEKFIEAVRRLDAPRAERMITPSQALAHLPSLPEALFSDKDLDD